MIYTFGDFLNAARKEEQLLLDALPEYATYMAETRLFASIMEEEIMITLDSFLNLPKPEIAKLVRESGNQVCVFPINGTRRWFALEHGHNHLTIQSKLIWI